MTVGAGLLLYAVVLGTLGPLAYRRDGWLSRAPRLGSTVLLAAAWSVLAALFLAGLTVAVPGTVLSNGLSDALGACLVRLRTAYATPGGAAAAAAGLTLTGVVVLRVAVAMATAGSGTAAAPRAALAAADSDIAVRVRRLLLPPRSLTPRRRHAVRAAVAALGLVPVLAALTPAGIALTQPPVRTPPAVVVPTRV
jgi:hypothetical protein